MVSLSPQSSLDSIAHALIPNSQTFFVMMQLAVSADFFQDSSDMVQWTLIITRSSGPEKYACCYETFLYEGYKNNTMQREFTIWDHKNYLVHNETSLYQSSL